MRRRRRLSGRSDNRRMQAEEQQRPGSRIRSMHDAGTVVKFPRQFHVDWQPQGSAKQGKEISRLSGLTKSVKPGLVIRRDERNVFNKL